MGWAVKTGYFWNWQDSQAGIYAMVFAAKKSMQEIWYTSFYLDFGF